MSSILLVEDEEHLAQGLAFNLRNSGYDVEIATTGEVALEQIDRQTFDAILLDVALPGISGLEVASRLRKAGNMLPIMMISARDRSQDTIAGLDAGADDYITKPFDLDEVLARLRGALRRQVWGRTSAPPPHQNNLRFGQWSVDFNTFVAHHDDGQEIELSAKELAMLRLFGNRPGEVISRADFLEEVWELPGSLETRTVDNFIRKLRQALEDDPSNPHHILSVRGAGYRFVP